MWILSKCWELELETGRLAQLTVQPPQGSGPVDVVLRTEDRFGAGRRKLALALPHLVVVATPDSGAARLTVKAGEGRGSVCPVR